MSKGKTFGLWDGPRDVETSFSKKFDIFDSLPKEIVAEILVRLPVESLMGLKSLNKSWYFFLQCLIKDPKFVAEHLHHCSNASSPSWLLVRNDEDVDEFEVFTTLTTSVKEVTEFVDDGGESIHYVTEDLDFPSFLQDGNPYYQDMCYCNGVVCLTKDFRTLILYNPVLREFSMFEPRSNLDKRRVVGMGFGCDLTGTNTYKVVILFETKEAGVFFPGTTNSWREISMDVQENFYSDLAFNVFLQGKCFWLTSDEPKIVLSFNVGSEAFESIALPCEPSSSEFHTWSLNIIHDSICACLNLGEVVDMWSMDVDTKSGGYFWTKTLRIESCQELHTLRGVFNDDEFLVETEDGEIAPYNPKTGELRSFNPNLWTDEVFYFDRYVKSLVSFKGINQA